MKVIATYLIALEDDKKDNICLQQISKPNGSKAWQLISIDTDHAFVAPMKQQGNQSLVNIKTVAFCFAQMNQSLDKQAIADFLYLDSFAVLNAWLRDCRGLDASYLGNLKATKSAGIFDAATIAKLAPLNSWFANKNFSFVPIAFEPGMVARLYQRWQRLVKVLATWQADEELTGFNLLSKVSPRLAYEYQKSFNQHNTVASRFDNLPTDYKAVEDNNHITQHTTVAR